MIEYRYLLGIISIIFLAYIVKIIFNKYSHREYTATNAEAVYKKVKKGYITLVHSLYHGENKEELEKRLSNLVKERSDGRYVGGYSGRSNEFDFTTFSLDLFYDMIGISQNKEEKFILSLDKNLTLKELNNFFKNILNKYIDANFFINENEKFFYKETLSQYEKKLKKHSIKIALLTDDFDSEYLIIFPFNKEKIVKNAVLNIGLKYNKEDN